MRHHKLRLQAIFCVTKPFAASWRFPKLKWGYPQITQVIRPWLSTETYGDDWGAPDWLSNLHMVSSRLQRSLRYDNNICPKIGSTPPKKKDFGKWNRENEQKTIIKHCICWAFPCFPMIFSWFSGDFPMIFHSHWKFWGWTPEPQLP